MILEILATIFLVLGGFFCLMAGIGVVRLGDIFLRMHASTKAGTLGIALIVVAMMFLAESWTELLEPVFVFLFMILTIPIGAHLIGRAAFRTRVPLQPDTRIEPECEAFRGDRIEGRPSGRTSSAKRPIPSP